MLLLILKYINMLKINSVIKIKILYICGLTIWSLYFLINKLLIKKLSQWCNTKSSTEIL